VNRGQVLRAGLWALRVLTVAGLVIDAYVHLNLASTYAESGGTINESVLFRGEAVVSLLAAALILATGRRAAYLAGVVIAASALAVLLVARYADIGAIGPFPDLYDPTWYPEKLLAAYAEAVAVLTALTAMVMITLAARRPKPPLNNRTHTQPVTGVSR
jgi:hexokinase